MIFRLIHSANMYVEIRIVWKSKFSSHSTAVFLFIESVRLNNTVVDNLFFLASCPLFTPNNHHYTFTDSDDVGCIFFNQTSHYFILNFFS